MSPVQVIIAIRPTKPDGTILWASEKVLELLLAVDGSIDHSEQNRIIRKLQHFCDANFKTFLPAIIKREIGKTFAIHLHQIRLAGFFDDGYHNFIAVEWFVKKNQQNDRRQSVLYEKVEKIRETNQWQKVR